MTLFVFWAFIIMFASMFPLWAVHRLIRYLNGDRYVVRWENGRRNLYMYNVKGRGVELDPRAVRRDRYSRY